MLQEIKFNTNYKTKIMKNRTGFYKKGNHSSHNLKLKSILSILTIGIFIFFGFASIEEGQRSTDCEFYKPPNAKTHIITIEIYDKETGMPIENQTIKFNIDEHKKVVNSNFDCELGTKSYSQTLNLGSSGKASLILIKTYVSKDDYTTIDFDLYRIGYQDAFKAFTIRDWDSNPTWRFGFLKIKVYP